MASYNKEQLIFDLALSQFLIDKGVKSIHIWDKRHLYRDIIPLLKHVTERERETDTSGERETERLMSHLHRIGRGRGVVDVSERGERERERECFSLPLATVGGGRLQPVVFSLSLSLPVMHIYTDAHTPLTHTLLLWLFRSLVCLLDPGVSFDVFFFSSFFSKWFFLLPPARWELFFKDK